MSGGQVPQSPGLECLVVDDEPQLRKVLAQVMRNAGLQCEEAADGAQAIAHMERHPVALLMSDMRMPHVDGMELLRQVRARWPDTAVVMITAVADVELAVSCLSTGALDYLTKPFHLEEVRARVALALEKRRLKLENDEYHQRLEERVAIQARRIEEMFLTGVQALAEALEVKDAYTRGHSVRVSQYAASIARAMQLEPEMIRQVRLGGHVHDIGKIGVREDVLNKPDRLTDDEYAHVMTHPLIGWRILSPLLGDAPIALNVVRSHHERYDGSGVPDGLKGEEIPLEARIVAVADALDAMTSGRPYRDAEFTQDQALAELQRTGGTQFDKGVVSALTAAMRRGGFALLPKTADTHVHVSL